MARMPKSLEKSYSDSASSFRRWEQTVELAKGASQMVKDLESITLWTQTYIYYQIEIGFPISLQDL